MTIGCSSSTICPQAALISSQQPAAARQSHAVRQPSAPPLLLLAELRIYTVNSWATMAAMTAMAVAGAVCVCVLCACAVQVCVSVGVRGEARAAHVPTVGPMDSTNHHHHPG